MKDSLLDSSIEHVEEDFKDGEYDLSNQKYGILQDDARKTNGNDDTSFIATNDESSIESDPFLNNDNLKYSAKKQEENSIADQVLSKFLLYSVIWTFYVKLYLILLLCCQIKNYEDRLSNSKKLKSISQTTYSQKRKESSEISKGGNKGKCFFFNV